MRKSDKSHFPLAVYCATYADGSTSRLSFGRRRQDGSPDAAKGRAFTELLYCTERKPLWLGGHTTYSYSYCPVQYDEDGWPIPNAKTITGVWHEHCVSRPCGAAPAAKPALIDGWIEFKGERTQDPHFAGEQPAECKPKRVSAKMALRDLLQALSNPDMTPDKLKPIFEQAKLLAA